MSTQMQEYRGFTIEIVSTNYSADLGWGAKFAIHQGGKSQYHGETPASKICTESAAIDAALSDAKQLVDQFPNQ